MKRVFALSVVCALMAACESETGTSTSYPSISDYVYIDLSADNAGSNVSAALRGVGNSGDGAGVVSDEAFIGSALEMAQEFASGYFNASSRQASSDLQSASGACEKGTWSREVSTSGSQASFSNCLIDGVTTTGRFSLVVSADSVLESDLSIVFYGLSQTESESGLTATLNGDLRLALQRSGTTLTNVMSSNSLNMVSSEDGNVVISDLDIVQVSNSSTQNSSLDIDYDIASDELEGRVTFDTVQSLNYEGGNDNPSTGILKLSGANGSSVTLDAFTGDVATVLMTVNNGSSVTSEEVRWDSIADSDLTGLADF